MKQPVDTKDTLDSLSSQATQFSENFEVTRIRRQIIKVRPNPDIQLDYITTLRAEMIFMPQNTPIKIITRYIPNKYIMRPESIEDYTAFLQKQSCETLESIAITVINDIKNTLLTRWCHVLLKGQFIINGTPQEHSVFSVDHAPGWKNDNILKYISLT